MVHSHHSVKEPLSSLGILQRQLMVSQRERSLRFLYLLISVQLVVIALLLLESLSNEYQSNIYMRAWIVENTLPQE